MVIIHMQFMCIKQTGKHDQLILIQMKPSF